MNLLPNTNRKNIQKGLILRFFIMFLYTVSICFVLGAVMLVPVFIFANLEIQEINSTSQIYDKNTDKDTESLLALPEQINNKLVIYRSLEAKNSFVDIIFSVVRLKSINIKIDSIAFNEDTSVQNGSGQLIISGNALTRNALIDFTKTLGDTNFFQNVDVPVSSLTKERNLPFSINLVLK